MVFGCFGLVGFGWCAGWLGWLVCFDGRCLVVIVSWLLFHGWILLFCVGVCSLVVDFVG